MASVLEKLVHKPKVEKQYQLNDDLIQAVYERYPEVRELVEAGEAYFNIRGGSTYLFPSSEGAFAPILVESWGKDAGKLIPPVFDPEHAEFTYSYPFARPLTVHEIFRIAIHAGKRAQAFQESPDWSPDKLQYLKAGDWEYLGLRAISGVVKKIQLGMEMEIEDLARASVAAVFFGLAWFARQD